MIPNFTLRLIPLALLCHNVEEAVGMRAFLPVDPALVPILPVSLVPTLTYGPFLLALGIVTAFPFALVAAYRFGRVRRAALFTLLALAATLLLNVLWHVGWSLALRGYTPGLVTALFVLLPAATYVLWRAWGDRWFPRRVLWSLPFAAILLHGPALFGLVYGARWLLANN